MRSRQGSPFRGVFDEEERPKTEFEDDITPIVIDIPMSYPEQTFFYMTMPLGIIVTVCLRENTITQGFANGRVKLFYTFKKAWFILQILFRNSSGYPTGSGLNRRVGSPCPIEREQYFP